MEALKNLYSVKYYMNLPEYKKQLLKLDKEQVRKELNEYGAWDDDELSDHEDNLQRLFLVTCSNTSDVL